MTGVEQSVVARQWTKPARKSASFEESTRSCESEVRGVKLHSHAAHLGGYALITDTIADGTTAVRTEVCKGVCETVDMLDIQFSGRQDAAPLTLADDELSRSGGMEGLLIIAAPKHRSR